MSSRQWLIIILVCSLAINLLLVGGIIGRLLTSPPPRPMPDHLGWLVRQLDEPRREELREDFMRHWRRARPVRREMRAAQENVLAAISAEEFDEQRTLEALDAVRTTSMEWQQETHRELVRILAKLEPEERQRVADFLRKHDQERRPPRR